MNIKNLSNFLFILQLSICKSMIYKKFLIYFMHPINCIGRGLFFFYWFFFVDYHHRIDAVGIKRAASSKCKNVRQGVDGDYGVGGVVCGRERVAKLTLVLQRGKGGIFVNVCRVLAQHFASQKIKRMPAGVGQGATQLNFNGAVDFNGVGEGRSAHGYKIARTEVLFGIL